MLYIFSRYSSLFLVILVFLGALVLLGALVFLGALGTLGELAPTPHALLREAGSGCFRPESSLHAALSLEPVQRYLPFPFGP